MYLSQRFFLFTIGILMLSACGSRDLIHPEENDEIKEIIDSTGGIFQAVTFDFEVPAQALSEQASFKIQKISKISMDLPKTNGSLSSFIMGDIKNKNLIGAWSIKTNARNLKKAIQISFKNPYEKQNLSNTITEVFVKDNRDGHIVLVGTYMENQPLLVEDLADRINEEAGGSVDLTYFAWRASLKDYHQTCAEEGGNTELGYCSFFKKQIDPFVQRQAGSMRILTWNVGNVAVTCTSYASKVCYQATERRISDQILALEQQQKPAVLFLQELWHGNCKYNSESSWGWNAWFNPRLCSNPTSGTPSIYRILGPNGSRYRYTCTATTDTGSKIINGYECVAVDPQQYSILTDSQLHPYCNISKGTTTPDPETYKDTGFQITTIRPVGQTGTLTLVNTHMAGTPYNNCRAEQLYQLKNYLVAQGRPSNLLAGDFNTEPYNDSYAGGVAFREIFTTNVSQPSGSIARIIDNGSEVTARYVFGSMSLDHVLSNTFDGSCTRGPAFDGTDHTWTSCILNR